MLTDKKIAAYSKIVAGLPDVPSPAMSPLQIKQWFDTAPEEIRVAFNALIDALGATTTGDSGAEAIGIEPIVGISAANVQNALEQLKLLINDAVAGAIPDGSIGVAKLSFDPATQPELDAHVSDFTTHVEYALATGAANTYAVTLTPAPTSYTRGMGVSVEINALNTGASTININGLGAKSIKNSLGNDVAAGNLKVGIIYTLRYNGTNFILQGEGGGGTAVAANILVGKTARVDIGDVIGTMPNQNAALVASTLGYASAGGGRMNIRPPAGSYPGSNDVYYDDPNFIAGNFRKDTLVYGLLGTLAPRLYATGGAVANSSFVITVSGLSFLPKLIYVYRNTHKLTYQYVTEYNESIDPTKFITWGTGAVSVITMPGGPGYFVNATGFKLEVSAASDNYTWEAYG